MRIDAGVPRGGEKSNDSIRDIHDFTRGFEDMWFGRGAGSRFVSGVPRFASRVPRTCVKKVNKWG